MPQKLLTIKEVADLLGVPKIKISELVERGELPAYKIGGKFIRFRKEQVEAIRNEILAEAGSSRPQSEADNGLAKTAPQESAKHVQDIAYTQSFAEGIKDFFYFNDFYIVAAAVACLILFFIFS